MAKSWQCTQCGQKITRGMIDSWNDGEPTECPTCGNDEFDVLRMTGRVHRAVDGPGETMSDQMTRRRAIQAVGGGVLALGGSYWLLGRPTVAETTDVTLKNSQFRPRNVEVASGETVVWTNEEDSGEGEKITYFLRNAGSDWEFESEVGEGDSATHTFEESGVYGLYADGLGGPDLSGMSMKIGVDESIDDPLGGWF